MTLDVTELDAAYRQDAIAEAVQTVAGAWAKHMRAQPSFHPGKTTMILTIAPQPEGC
jgi:hypothetical protein